jgi:hypothetical protein
VTVVNSYHAEMCKFWDDNNFFSYGWVNWILNKNRISKSKPVLKFCPCNDLVVAMFLNRIDVVMVYSPRVW